VCTAAAFPPSGAILRDTTRPVRLPIGPRSDGAIGLRDITDGTSNTLLISPVAPDRKIPWTRPEDIAVGADFPGLGQPTGIAAPYRSRRRPDGHHVAPVLFADGSVRVLIDTIEPKVMAALLTRAGGEVINLAALPSDPDPTRVPMYVSVRIRRDGDRVWATIEPTE
jgi:prepilin-type processing-associated H-X9-DG protein